MNVLVFLNFAVFAVLLSLFSLELGAAVLSLANYEHYRRRIITYIAPVWEITGTFSVFFVVNLVATYPGLIPALDLYIAPVLLAAVFLIIRDAFLAYSELAGKELTRRYTRIYSICTIIMMFLLVSVLASAFTGVGVNLQAGTVDLIAIIANPFAIGMFLSLVSLVSLSSMVFYEVRRLRYYLLGIVFTAAAMLATLCVMPGLPGRLAGGALLFILPVAVFLVVTGLYVKKSHVARFLVLPMLLASLLAIELAVGPYLFGGAVDMTAFLTPAASQPYVLAISVAGGALLSLALALFVYVQHVHKKGLAGKGRRD